MSPTTSALAWRRPSAASGTTRSRRCSAIWPDGCTSWREDTDGWVPQWFEFAFGLPHDEGRDLASLPDPVTLDGRFILRGSMDLVERHPAGALRVTDHKTGRARWPDRMIVAGGEALQPLLYGLALEAATGQPVLEGRLWFCTAAGEFAERLGAA